MPGPVSSRDSFPSSSSLSRTGHTCGVLGSLCKNHTAAAYRKAVPSLCTERNWEMAYGCQSQPAISQTAGIACLGNQHSLYPSVCSDYKPSMVDHTPRGNALHHGYSEHMLSARVYLAEALPSLRCSTYKVSSCLVGTAAEAYAR